MVIVVAVGGAIINALVGLGAVAAPVAGAAALRGAAQRPFERSPLLLGRLQILLVEHGFEMRDELAYHFAVVTAELFVEPRGAREDGAILRLVPRVQL